MAKTMSNPEQSRDAARVARKHRDRDRALSMQNRKDAAKVYIKASQKIGEPVPQSVRDLASGN